MTVKGKNKLYAILMLKAKKGIEWGYSQLSTIQVFVKLWKMMRAVATVPSWLMIVGYESN